MKRQWRCASTNIHYYHKVSDGLIVGRVYNLANTIIWSAKIPISSVEELILGEFIEMEFAKRAIEKYWDDKDRTLEVPHEHLLSTQRS
jgi:hypothetical protein